MNLCNIRDVKSLLSRHGFRFSKRTDAGAYLQYAVGVRRAAGSGNLPGNPVRDKEVLTHGFGKAKAVAAEEGLDVPESAYP